MFQWALWHGRSAYIFPLILGCCLSAQRLSGSNQLVWWPAIFLYCREPELRMVEVRLPRDVDLSSA